MTNTDGIYIPKNLNELVLRGRFLSPDGIWLSIAFKECVTD